MHDIMTVTFGHVSSHIHQCETCSEAGRKWITTLSGKVLPIHSMAEPPHRILLRDYFAALGSVCPQLGLLLLEQRRQEEELEKLIRQGEPEKKEGT